MNRMLSPLFTLLLLTISACPDGDVVTRQTPPLLVVNTDLLDFGEVPVANQVVRTLRVLNSGQATLEITDINIGEGLSIFSASQTSFSLNAEESTYVNIIFNPAEITTYQSELVFQSNSRDDEGQKVILSGEGVDATVCGDCDAPPEATCLSETTLLLYDNRGTCVEGACQYHARTVECESGCNEETGQCNDDEGNEPAPPDRDDDGIADEVDPCPDDPLDNDSDGDGICSDDNCPDDPNPDQVDADGDGLGNVCDPCPTEVENDQDEDGICESVDNCDLIANPDQADTDADTVGDVCDLCPEMPAREHLDLNANDIGDDCEFQLALNHYQACALTTSGGIECWGAENEILTCAVAGACGDDSQGAPNNAVQMSLGSKHACAVTEGGAVQCWGAGTTHTNTDEEYGQAMAPEGLFWKVYANDNMNCGIKRDHSIHCWGIGNDGEAPSNQNDWTTFYNEIPEGQYIDLSLDGFGGCALKLDGELTCWGAATSSFWGEPPSDVLFDRFDFIYQHACAVTSENAIECWGFIPVISPEGDFEKVGVGFEDNCALRVDGTAYCWGNGGASGTTAINTVPDATEVYWNLHMSTSTACGVRADGKIRCWGLNGAIIDDVPTPYRVE